MSDLTTNNLLPEPSECVPSTDKAAINSSIPGVPGGKISIDSDAGLFDAVALWTILVLGAVYVVVHITEKIMLIKEKFFSSKNKEEKLLS